MRKLNKKLTTGVAVVLISCVILAIALGGIRGPGKYNGVVIFDRWGACYLYSGVYLMPISESVKASLRAFDGEPVLIDAQEVLQRMNPGDGLITKLKVLGPAVEPSQSTGQSFPKLEGLTLEVSPDFSTQNQLIVELRNNDGVRHEIRMDALGLTILAKKRGSGCVRPAECLNPADGPSYAAVARCSMASLHGHPGEACAFDGYGISLALGTVIPANLDSGQGVKITLLLRLPLGEYEFLAGYGGGVHEARTLVSNRISFDVDDAGKARTSVAHQ